MKNTAKSLPKTIEPIRLTDIGGQLQGQISFAGMARLKNLLHEKMGKAEIKLTFGKDLQGIRNISGKIDSEIVLKCQRCLQPVAYKLAVPVKLSPIFNDAGADNLPEEYEPLLVKEESMALVDLVEEELLLSLPIVAKHELGTCPNPLTKNVIYSSKNNANAQVA
jgi:uncharacterized protein